MSKLDFDTAVKQEAAYLRLVYPTPDDIPGCVSLFDTILSCHSMYVFIFFFGFALRGFRYTFASKVAIQIRRKIRLRTEDRRLQILLDPQVFASRRATGCMDSTESGVVG